jgi:ribosomal-protein-alanine N-acetyltransferase
MKDELQFTPELMKASDIEEVLDIETVSFAAPWTRDMYIREISNPISRVFVFRLGDEIVGYLCFWMVLDEAHVLTIAVHPGRRRLGYGTLIMSHLETVCREYGLKRILLEVGRQNTRARSLYKKLGFKSIGFRKEYYAEEKDDALVMEKWLPVEDEPTRSLAAPEERL